MLALFWVTRISRFAKPTVRGGISKRTLGEIANTLNGVAGFSLPAGIAPGLAATSDYQPPAITYTNGSHVAEVEVDPETGHVRITRYVVVHDCGHMINPMRQSRCSYSNPAICIAKYLAVACLPLRSDVPAGKEHGDPRLRPDLHR